METKNRPGHAVTRGQTRLLRHRHPKLHPLHRSRQAAGAGSMCHLARRVARWLALTKMKPTTSATHSECDPPHCLCHSPARPTHLHHSAAPVPAGSARITASTSDTTCATTRRTAQYDNQCTHAASCSPERTWVKICYASLWLSSEWLQIVSKRERKQCFS